MEPLAALMLPLTVLADAIGAGPDDPRPVAGRRRRPRGVERRRARAELRAALPAALQLAVLGRRVTWVRCLAPMDDAELAEWGSRRRRRWASLLEPPPLGHLPG